MAEKPRRLGRGLEALLNPTAQPVTTDDRAYRRVALAQIRPNPFQPRKEFREEDLVDLEASLRATGLLQPITLRPAPTGGGFELIAGERRLRAATRLGWSDIPAVIKEIDDQTLLTLALVENLQRADLNPIEEGEGYRRLIDEFGLTQQQVADAVGKDRSTVANTLRLLTLPASIRRMLQGGQLTLGHARALLALPNEHAMVELARETVARKLTVRDVERRAKLDPATTTTQKGTKQPTPPPAEVRRITDLLRRHLQTDVSLSADARHRGQIHIAFYSADDLHRLIELITGRSTDEV